MAYLYYTITAVVLYIFSDWLLNQIEKSMGKRLKYRSVVFFAIIMTLSLTSFNMIDRIVGDLPQTSNAQTEVLPAN
jgi:hypothetical protein